MDNEEYTRIIIEDSVDIEIDNENENKIVANDDNSDGESQNEKLEFLDELKTMKPQERITTKFANSSVDKKRSSIIVTNVLKSL